MKLVFVFCGGDREAWLEELSASYLKKISPICKVEIQRIKPTKIARDDAGLKRAAESAAILKVLKPEDFLILCDERGQQLDSKKMSAKLMQSFSRTQARVVIVVGGAFGASAELAKRANWTWSLSTLVFNHHIAQAVVLEQIYRSLAIWKNLPYHNE